MGLFSGIGGAITALNPVGAIGTIGAGLLGGGLDYLGAQQQNASARQQADEQMAFQERMSDTAHQREVEDLKKAGLNPVLSANAGASTPTGAAAPVVNEMSGVADKLSGIPGNLMSLATSAQSIRESESRANLNDEQAKNIQGGWATKVGGTRLFKSIGDMITEMFKGARTSAQNIRSDMEKWKNKDNGWTPLKGDWQIKEGF